MYLFGDTETTGFAKKGSCVQEGQARICQLALLLVDENRNTVAEFSALIKPDGWIISDGAYETHGKSMEDCERYGLPIASAYGAFDCFAKRAGLFVCHNMNFDWRLLEIEAAYGQKTLPQIQKFCTMKAATPVCKLPGRYGDFKWPKAIEALQILCDRDIGDDAHDAMHDTRACKDIFFALMDKGIINPPERKERNEGK